MSDAPTANRTLADDGPSQRSASIITAWPSK
jgi:hypothetical protein